MDFHKIWQEQSAAARTVRERFGVENALDYLIGEKLLNFAKAADQAPEFAAELPRFQAAVWEIFEQQAQLMRSSRFPCSSASSSKAGTIPACKVTRFRSASSHVSLETQISSSNSPLKSTLQLLLAGRNTADGVRNFVFGSSVATWKRSNRPLLFPLPLPPSNVRRY